MIVTQVHAEVLFSENFERGLSQWVGKEGAGHHGVIVKDPIEGDHALTFRKLNCSRSDLI